jgi:hypothetical protein
MVKEFIIQNNTTQIKKILKVLGQDFTLGQNPNARKGGLIGLAATAIALGKVQYAILLKSFNPTSVIAFPGIKQLCC